MYYRDLPDQAIKLNNTRAMQVLPRAMCRVLLSFAAAILLAVTPCARAGEITQTTASARARTERLIFTPASLRFGGVAVDRRQSLPLTITNWSKAEITLLQVKTQGKDFTLSGLLFPLTLAGGESFTINVVFAPRSSGNKSESFSFISDASDVSNLKMLVATGEGTDDSGLTVNPGIMNFDTVQVGTSATQPGTLTVGDAPVTISSAVSSSPDFTLSGASFPLTIPAWGSQGFLVTFAPQASGPVSATLSFMDVSGTALAVESLNGVGAASNGHSVDLSWNASTSRDVIGYNIYRGTKSGGPYRKINSVLDAATVYTDTSIRNGTTYYYVTTAVDSNNEESVYSNEAPASVPWSASQHDEP